MRHPRVASGMGSYRCHLAYQNSGKASVNALPRFSSGSIASKSPNQFWCPRTFSQRMSTRVPAKRRIARAARRFWSTAAPGVGDGRTATPRPGAGADRGARGIDRSAWGVGCAFRVPSSGPGSYAGVEGSAVQVFQMPKAGSIGARLIQRLHLPIEI
jgi:hypothetical protein